MIINKEEIIVIENQVFLYPDFFNNQEAGHFLEALIEKIQWQQEQIIVFGRNVTVPRLIAWHGDAHVCYRYSGIDHIASPWNTTLTDIRDRVSDYVSESFNGVLLNLYRNGQDSMGWHSDDEPEMGSHPVIASVSLGQERNFQLRRKDNHKNKINLVLPHGSLLLMQGNTQLEWQHQLPKSRRVMTPRINLTYRKIISQPG